MKRFIPIYILWNRYLIEELRKSRTEVPNVSRIVVAIDPAVSCGEDSDETRIVVAALGVDGFKPLWRMLRILVPSKCTVTPYELQAISC